MPSVSSLSIYRCARGQDYYTTGNMVMKSIAPNECSVVSVHNYVSDRGNGSKNYQGEPS